MDCIENLIYSNPSAIANLDGAKKGLTYLMKTYGKEWIDKYAHILLLTNLEDLGWDKTTPTIEEYLYKYAPIHYSSVINREDLISDIRLEQSLFNKLMEKAANQQLMGWDTSLYEYIAANPYLSEEQIFEIKDTVQGNRPKGLWRDEQSHIDSILGVLVRNHISEEKDIRNMYYGTEAEKRAICNYCSNIPEDIIRDRIDEIKSSNNDLKGNSLLPIICNNNNVSLEIINEFMNCAEIFPDDAKFIYRDIMEQKQLTIDIMKEIAIKSPFYSVETYLSRDMKLEEVTEIYANSKEKSVRENIAKELIKGSITVSEETFRRLALDSELSDEVKMKLLEMPEFKERIPEMLPKDRKLNLDYYDYTYGGWGPGDFDNMGGERRFFVNGKCILSEEGFRDSYAYDEEGRKWARNAYTNFNVCTDYDKFIEFCKEHREAIAIVRKNEEKYGSFKNLTTRIEILERTMTRETPESVKTSDDIAEIVEQRSSDGVNTVIKEITTAMEKDTDPLKNGDEVVSDANKSL